MIKIFTFVCLFIGLAQCGKPNEKCWRECDWKKYVALVKCPEAEADPCTCEETDGASCDDKIGPDNLRFNTWEDCHELATSHTSDTLANTYFRWEDKTTETYCYFLPDCDIEVPSGCAPFAGAHCVAGPSTEECEELPVPLCNAATWETEGLHWNCLSASGLETINPYNAEGDDTKIPKGTTCQTGKECSTWKWHAGEGGHENMKKIAKVKCGDNAWVSDPDDLLLETNEDEPKPILPDQNDGVCICDPLPIKEETLATPGLSLLCEDILNPNGDGETQIEYGNACVLTCDGHFVMYIECYKGQWMNTAEYPFIEVTEDSIKC